MSSNSTFASHWENELIEGLKRARVQQGMSQMQLAQQMSELGFPFHQATVYKIESGDRKVTAAEAYGLAEVLNVDLDELFHWDLSSDAPERRKRILWTQADRLTTAILKLDVIARYVRMVHAAFVEGVRKESAFGLTTGRPGDTEQNVGDFYRPLVNFHLHNELLWRMRNELWTPEFERAFADSSGISGLGPMDSDPGPISEREFPRDA